MMTAQYQAALHSYAEGRYEEAMQQFSELLYEDPRNPKLHIWLGATFRKAGKIEYAKVQYQQVLTLTDDPDLLDLASTSLAQIQNKLVNAKNLPNSGSTKPSDIQEFKDTSEYDDSPNSIVTQVNLLQKKHGKQKNSVSKKPTKGSTPPENGQNRQHLSAGDLGTEVVNLSASTNSENGASRWQGVIPPPPVIAASLKHQNHQNHLPETLGSLSLAISESADKHSDESAATLNASVDSLDLDGLDQNSLDQDRTAKAAIASPVFPLSILENTFTNIREGNKASKKSKNYFASVDAVVEQGSEVANIPDISDDKAQSVGSTANLSSSLDVDDFISYFPEPPKHRAVALEDMLKFSSVSQKVTLWGTLIATIPAIALGGVAYGVGSYLLLERAKQGQKLETMAIANAANTFLQQQRADVGVLQKLLATTELNQANLGILQSLNAIADAKSVSSPLSLARQRQYKQQLTNRLNLYNQAYPQYASIAVFSTNGELIAQSSKAKTLQTLVPEAVSKFINSNNNQAGNRNVSDSITILNPIRGKEGVNFYVVSSVKSAASEKVSVILQVELPVTSLESQLTKASNGNGKSNFYVVDSANKYVASSQSVTVGDDASNSFAAIAELRSGQDTDLREVKGDRSTQILTYADVNSNGLAVLTAIEKSALVEGQQNLLLVIGIGIATTPFAIAMIAYALSRQLSSRLKSIRDNLQQIGQGKARPQPLSTEGNDELRDISISINTMSEQFQAMMQKQEQEKQRLQVQVVKLFKVLAKLAREDRHDIKEEDISDEQIRTLGKKIRGEMVQRHAEAESYRQQKEEMKEQLMQMLRDMQGLADGDLRVSTQAVDANLVNVSIFFDDVMRGLHNIVSQIRSSASQVNFSLGQNEQMIANLASVSQRQADMVTRSLNAAQMSSLSANTIVQQSHQARQSSQTVAEQISNSDRSIDAVIQKINDLQNTVSNTAKRVKHLGEASQKIGKAISSINEIAIKTNFLAINASLEASRSNSSNGNFVSVAEEVSELASRSLAATKEVENLLGNIQQETSAVMAAVESGSQQAVESTQLTNTAKDSLNQIGQISQQIDELVSAIADATISQVQTSEGVANLMKDISHIAKRNLVASEEVTKSFQSTKRYAGDLQQSLSHLKTR